MSISTVNTNTGLKDLWGKNISLIISRKKDPVKNNHTQTLPCLCPGKMD